MANLRFRNRGYKEIYLTKYYNPLTSFNPYKDNAGFNDSNNSFSDYCFTTTCSSWQNDKIKILSLPDKGKLFYQTNPGSSIANYANVTIGQMILVRDLIDHRILKFNAEGSYDNQFTGNYVTQFNIERFCGNNSNNTINTVKLNLIEVNVIIYEAYPLMITQSCSSTGNDPNNYNVNCVGSLQFSLSDSNIIGTNFGFARLLSNGSNSEISLKKINGDSLSVGEILPVSTSFITTLNATGQNPPNAFPWGYPSQPDTAGFIFEFSLNGIDDWQSFLLTIYA